MGLSEPAKRRSAQLTIALSADKSQTLERASKTMQPMVMCYMIWGVWVRRPPLAQFSAFWTISFAANAVIDVLSMEDQRSLPRVAKVVASAMIKMFAAVCLWAALFFSVQLIDRYL